MKKTISLGSRKAGALVLILALGLAAEVANADFVFGEPTNLGSPINSSYDECVPNISADGLSLYFGEYQNNRPNGYGGTDIWLSTRETVEDVWGTPVNLEPINTSADDGSTYISSDGLVLYFGSMRPGGYGAGGYGDWDLWVATRATTDDPWGEPNNLGPTVNSEYQELRPSLSADGLSLYFSEGPYSFRPDGVGGGDLWVSTRATVSEPWGPPENLGPAVNSSAYDIAPSISSDERTLFFQSRRSGDLAADIWMTTRATTEDDWAPAVKLESPINTSASDCNPNISADGYTLYFSSNREGGQGGWDLYQTPILPVVDLNGDGIVDCADICIMVDHWGTDEPLCDIGPTPLGDGIVDVQDLIVLAEYLLPVGPEEVNVNEENDGGQIELEQGQILVVTLKSNPTTGYRWEVAEIQESILEQMGEAEFKPSETSEPPISGAGGWEIFRFKAIGAGQMTLQLIYHAPWEEGVEPINTFSIEVAVN